MILLIIQARCGSSRLKEKVFLELNKKSILNRKLYYIILSFNSIICLGEPVILALIIYILILLL